MTETLITVSARADGPRGRAASAPHCTGVETRVASEPGQAVGELQVRGSTLFNGYGPTEAHRGSVHPGRVVPDRRRRDHRRERRRTGSSAAFASDLIKSGGFRVGAGEVEDALLTHPAVREAAVVGRPHADLGEEIVAFVVADPVSADALIDHVATTLSKHKRPRRVVFLDALPRNPMGKIQKHRLT